MNESEIVEITPRSPDSVGPYTVYSAGGLFTQHELAMNVLVKEAVWRLSDGKFQLILPQSRELQQLDRLDVESHLRNIDLLEVVRADIIIAYFDGLELDSGTVVEFTVAKNLGKPVVIVRSDFRRSPGSGLSEPYNLMVKNWPRTTEIHLDAYVLWAGLYSEMRKDYSGSFTPQAAMKAELDIVKKSTDEIARQVIAGLELVIKMKSPYPPEYQEVVYEAVRFSPGSGFDELLTPSEIGEIIERLRKNGTL